MIILFPFFIKPQENNQNSGDCVNNKITVNLKV